MQDIIMRYSLLAKKVNLAMLIPAWFYVGNAI